MVNSIVLRVVQVVSSIHNPSCTVDNGDHMWVYVVHFGDNLRSGVVWGSFAVIDKRVANQSWRKIAASFSHGCTVQND